MAVEDLPEDVADRKVLVQDVKEDLAQFGSVSVSVSHVYFMKYSMMGPLQMPNIMSSNRSRPCL